MARLGGTLNGKKGLGQGFVGFFNGTWNGRCDLPPRGEGENA